MEFVRKTLIGLALVVGGLFTMHSLGEQAIRAFAPIQSSTAKTDDPPVPSTYVVNQVAARRWALGKAEVPEPGPEVQTALTPAAVDPTVALTSNDTAEGDAAIAEAAVALSSPWRSLGSELWSSLLGLLQNFVADLALAAVSGGIVMYFGYPRIQRISRSRQRRAALRRAKQRQLDEELLAEDVTRNHGVGARWA
jgi:hypothetical protein